MDESKIIEGQPPIISEKYGYCWYHYIPIYKDYDGNNKILCYFGMREDYKLYNNYVPLDDCEDGFNGYRYYYPDKK